MSKVLTLDLQNKSVFQFDAVCNLAYSLCGNPAVIPGGNFPISIPDDVSASPYLDFGRMVIIQPTDLGTYAGMLDTPWKASATAVLTVYDIEYLLNLRAPETPVKFSGSIDQIFSQVLDLANSFEDLNLRLGDVYDVDPVQRDETFDCRPLWEQLQTLAVRAGVEFVFRPERAADKSWYIYLDLAKQIGSETGFELVDGDQGNMTVNDAQVRGEIINRKVGINSASTTQSRLQTDPFVNDSYQQYRLRNRVLQSRDINDLKTLEANTQTSLAASSYPYLELSVDVENKKGEFKYLRPGNSIMTHASRLRLPRGVRGWRGMTRITKMSYKESTNTVSMTLIGAL